MSSSDNRDIDFIRNLCERLDRPMGPELRFDQLTGGVSSIVLRVSDGQSTVIVKQARSELDVADSWIADPRRSHVEAEALRLMNDLVQGYVPEVLAEDEDLHAIVLEAAPEDWRNYKTLLLEGTASALTSGHMGDLLARWHGSTACWSSMPETFNRPEALRELRIEPFFLTVARKHPEFSAVVLRAAAFLTDDACCLVHGDATPKNVLVSSEPSRFWLLDAEVMHFGRPELDVAMWCAHLFIKAHRTTDQAFGATLALGEFATAYRDSENTSLIDDDELRNLIAAVVYARLFGTSRVDYLESVDIEALRNSVTRLLDSRRPILAEFSTMEIFG